MNCLVRQFLREIVDEHSGVNHVCDDYGVVVTLENLPCLMDMVGLDDNVERRKSDLQKLAVIRVGDVFHMYGFDRNRYVKQKLKGLIL